METDAHDAASAAPARDLKTQLIEYERELILYALGQAGGNQRRAASILGVGPTTLCEKMKRLGLRGLRR
jgi:DNA-binding NtrC family response regulator